MQELRDHYSSLTPRERDVMALVVSGLLNEQVEGELGITESTVKAHRGQVIQRMKANSVADLVKMTARLHQSAATNHSLSLANEIGDSHDRDNLTARRRNLTRCRRLAPRLGRAVSVWQFSKGVSAMIGKLHACPKRASHSPHILLALSLVYVQHPHGRKPSWRPFSVPSQIQLAPLLRKPRLRSLAKHWIEACWSYRHQG